MINANDFDKLYNTEIHEHNASQRIWVEATLVTVDETEFPFSIIIILLYYHFVNLCISSEFLFVTYTYYAFKQKKKIIQHNI